MGLVYCLPACRLHSVFVFVFHSKVRKQQNEPSHAQCQGKIWTRISQRISASPSSIIVNGGNAMDVRACTCEDDFTKPHDLSKRKHLF